MATITQNTVGANQFGGATPYGNLTTIRATLETGASGGSTNGSSADPITAGDEVVLAELPEGMVLEDAQIVVSTGMSSGVTGKLGFKYVDGVDSSDVPQDDDYFFSGQSLSATARERTSSTEAPVKLPKPAYLVLTVAGADNEKASRIDFIVHGERMGPA